MPPRRRHEVRREQHVRPAGARPSQRLLHLGRVPVREQSVRRHVLVRLREQARRLQPATRARHARHRVGDDARLDEPEREQRRARQAHRGGIAAGRRDVRVRCEIVAVQLDQPVREPADDLGRAVRLAVPARVHVGREPEVGAEVDHVGDVVEQTRAGGPGSRRAGACRTRGRDRARSATSSGARTASPYAGVSDGVEVGDPARPRSTPP